MGADLRGREQGGLKHYFVEQDQWDRPSLESARMSAEYLNISTFHEGYRLEPSPFRLATDSRAKCRPDEVIVRTAFCGICGTDLEILHGTMPDGFTRYPVVPGHEWTGTVEEIGSQVGNLRVGDRPRRAAS